MPRRYKHKKHSKFITKTNKGNEENKGNQQNKENKKKQLSLLETINHPIIETLKEAKEKFGLSYSFEKKPNLSQFDNYKKTIKEKEVVVWSMEEFKKCDEKNYMFFCMFENRFAFTDGIIIYKSVKSIMGEDIEYLSFSKKPQTALSLYSGVAKANGLEKKNCCICYEEITTKTLFKSEEEANEKLKEAFLNGDLHSFKDKVGFGCCRLCKEGNWHIECRKRQIESGDRLCPICRK